jgi:hypothetical protein
MLLAAVIGTECTSHLVGQVAALHDLTRTTTVITMAAREVTAATLGL